MESRIQQWGQEDINAQQNCPFYNGLLPQEILDLIFGFALAPETVPSGLPRLDPDYDFCIRDDHKPGDDEPKMEPSDESTWDQAMPDRHESLLGLPSKKELGFDWFRPGSTGQRVFPGQVLLQTCRRVYLDTYKLLERSRVTVIFEGRYAPWGFATLKAFTRRLEAYYKQQLPQPRSIHMYAQMHRLVRFSLLPPSLPQRLLLSLPLSSYSLSSQHVPQTH